jgi:hypothetical protein
MTSRLRLLLAPVLVCVAAMGWAADAHAAKRMEVALADDNVFLRGLWNPFTGLQKAREMNVTWLRVNLTWRNAMSSKQANSKKTPSEIQYDWVPWDDVVNRAANEGIKVELTLTGPAPRWATGKKRKNGLYKPSAGKFGAFARAAAQHFDGRVTRYTIWNEPNLIRWLQPIQQSPRLYRNLYSSAYRGIKGVNSSNQVLIGETAPYGNRDSGGLRTIAPLKFLRGVTRVNSRYKGRRGSGLKTDGYAHHPYDFKHKPTYKYPGKDNVTLATLGRLTKALSKLRKARALTTPTGGVPYVYLTEYGYFAAYKYKLSRSKQASYLKKGFTIAQKNKRVKQMLQYTLVPPPSQGAFFATQIMSRKFTPYKAYKVLKSWAAAGVKRGRVLGNPRN